MTEQPTTLDELMARRADTLSQTDLEILTAALSEQRTRWLANQAVGSRKLVRAKDVKLKQAPLELDMSGVKPARIVL